MKRQVCGIIPPIVLEKIEENAPSEKARRIARKTLLVSERLRGVREQKAVQPGRGQRREVYDAKDESELPGELARKEDDPETGEMDVDEAFDASGCAYVYYLDHYGRRSLDDKNMTLCSTVHFDDVAGDDIGFDNAFWDGDRMVYGRGYYFNSFTRSLSVVVHELTHGVIQYTSNLIYRNQPGALNEHLADAFGALANQFIKNLDPLASNSWSIGEELVRGKIKGSGLRNMLYPGTAYDDPVIGRDMQPAHMRQYVKTRDDNGGVHINSGIPNRAFALLVQAIAEKWPGGDGGKRPGEVAGGVWYRAMVSIGARCEFDEFAATTYSIAKEVRPAIADMIGTAWEKVGLSIASVDTPSPTDDDPCDFFGFAKAIREDPELRGHVMAILQSPTARRAMARVRASVQRT